MTIDPSAYWPNTTPPIANGEVANEVRWWQRLFKPVSNSFDQITADDTGWVDVLALSNSWVAYSGTTPNAGYRRRRGLVFLQGLVKSGSTATIFTLPAGFRPAYGMIFVCVSNTGCARIDIAVTGTVSVVAYAYGGSNGFIDLSAVRFFAEQ